MSPRADSSVSSIPPLFAKPSHRWYAAGKLRGDRIYPEVLRHLPDDGQPILDIGCGIGLMAFYLRAAGRLNAYRGLDADERKVLSARAASTRSRWAGDAMRFEHGNARALPEFAGHVLLLDVVHYLPVEAQLELMRNAARRTAAGCRLVLRDALADGSRRAKNTMLQEKFSRSIGWLRGERLEFPVLESISNAAEGEGLARLEVVPMFERNPYNNHLVVWERSGNTVRQPSDSM